MTRLLRMVALAAILALVATSCGGNDAQESGQETGAPEPTVEETTAQNERPGDETCRDLVSADPSLDEIRERVELILPTDVDVPEELGYASCERSLANPGNSLAVFENEAAEALTESGVLESLVAALEHRFYAGGDLADGAMRAGALVLEDEASARELVRQVLPILTDQGERVEDPLEPLRPIPANGLGEESFGLRGTLVPAAPNFDAVLYIWNRADLVLSVWGWGPLGEPDTAPRDEMLEVARLMDERAS